MFLYCHAGRDFRGGFAKAFLQLNVDMLVGWIRNPDRAGTRAFCPLVLTGSLSASSIDDFLQSFEISGGYRALNESMFQLKAVRLPAHCNRLASLQILLTVR